MREKLLILIGLLSITLSVCAKDLTNPSIHFHGDRSHKHSFPKEGVAHKHGNLLVGRLSKNLGTQTMKKEKNEPKIEIYGLPYRIKRAQANGTIQGRTEVISGLAIGKHSSGNVNTLRKNSGKARNYIKIECRKLAERMKSEFFKYSKFENIYGESFSYCMRYSTNDLEKIIN